VGVQIPRGFHPETPAQAAVRGIKLFWSVTVYDTDTRNQVITDQGKAALRSLFELKGKNDASPIDLYFAPSAPAGHEGE
jgi:hypothetical protein